MERTDTTASLDHVAAAPPTVYTLVHSRVLPQIDTTKNIKHVVLSPQGLVLFNRFVRAWRRWIGVGYWVGVTLATITLFSPARIGVWLAIVSMPLQLVPSLFSILVMRYDMAKLIVRGYEFWYLTMSNAVVSTLISLSFNDARCFVLVGASMAFETALLLDANHRASKLVSVATILGALTNVVYVVCATFRYIDYGDTELEVVRYKHHVLHADDVISNLIATLVVLLVRNGVRKFCDQGSSRRMTPCITYRCRIAFALVGDAQQQQQQVDAEEEENKPSAGANKYSQSRASTIATIATTRTLKVVQRTQLEFVSDGATFSSTHVVLPLAYHGIVSGFVAIAQVASWLSLASWAVSLVATNATLVRIASTLAAASALVVFLFYLAFAQRQLLRRLLWSFDCVFLSIQFSVTHLCLADIVGWGDPRVLTVLASWLLLHWVLMLDAVLPIHKSKSWLRYKPAVTAAVVVLFIVEQALAVAVLVFYDDSDATSHDPRLDLSDHQVFTVTLHGRVKVFYVVPMLLGRIVTTLSWSLRLLWRLRNRRHRPNDLLMLQGQVQYETSPGSFTVAQLQRPMMGSGSQIAPLSTTTP